MSDFPIAVCDGPHDQSPVFFFCDHAVSTIPDDLQSLGLSPAQLQDHIAFDPGSADVARALAKELSARAVYCGYSRLIIDPNRGVDRTDLIMKTSDTVLIPGNQNLTEQQKRHRLDSYHRPYHQILEEELDKLTDLHPDPLVVSVHSFSRTMRGEQRDRPWEAGLLWRDDQPSAALVMDHLRSEGVLVGDNQPYSAKIYNYSVNRHVGSRGLRHLTLEICQDSLTNKSAINRWKNLLLPPLQALIRGS